MPKETEERRKEFLTKTVQERGDYGVFKYFRDIFGQKEADKLIMGMPKKSKEKMEKIVYRFGFEDLDFRNAADYGDPEAEKTFRN